MRRVLFWVLGAVLVLAALVAATFLFLPTDRIAAVATERLSQATGREVRVGQDVRPTLWPNLGVEINDLVIGNPDWVEDGPLLSAGRVEVGVAWGPLLGGEIALQTVVIEAPSVLLVRDAEGRASWDFSSGENVEAAGETSAASPTEEAGSLRLGVAELRITEGTFAFRDEGAGTDLRFEPVDVTVTDANGPTEIIATLGTQAGAFEVAANVADLSGLLAGEVSAVDAALDWPGGAAGFDGRLGLAPALDGQLSLDAGDFSVPLALARMPAPDLPAGLGEDRVTFAGRITLAPEGSFHLREARLRLDDNTISANLDLLPGGARPLIRGTMALDQFILPQTEAIGTVSSGTGAEASAAEAGGWSTAPIDVSGLFAIDAELDVTAAALGTEEIALQDLAASLRLDNGRAVLEVQRGQLFDGALSGQFVLNGRGGLSARADAAIDGIALQPAVTAFAGFDRLQGTGSGNLSVLAVGNSQAALMRSLEGQGRIDFGNGAIEGLDIGGMIRNFDAGFRGEGARTVYDAITASFTLSGGVLSNSDLNLAASWGGVSGTGEVDIGAQRMDYLVTPGVLRSESGSNRLSVPVRIIGPWSDLSYRPDLEALADEELAEEIEQIEERLADQAREAVADRLGVEIDPEAGRDEAVDQIQDALEDRLRDELEGGLRDLFR